MHEYSNLSHSTAGLFHLDPLGEMSQTTMHAGEKTTGNDKYFL